MSGKVVFIGCGKIATQSALALQSDGIDVLGVRRNNSKLPETLPSHPADALVPSSLEFLQAHKPGTLVYSVTAETFTESSYINAYINGLKNVIAATDSTTLKRLIFVSSTAVYHQNDGSSVDESSATEPQRFNGQVMLQAEQLALSTGVGMCLRFSGIYGPGRTRMVDRVRKGQCSDEASTTYTNRIHSDDCAGILAHLIKQPSAPEIVIGSDSSPATGPELESFIATQLGIEKRYADKGKNKPTRIAGSKRCNNRLLLDTGYKLIYPDYRAGYAALINSL